MIMKAKNSYYKMITQRTFINISLSVTDQHHHKFIVHIFCDCRSYLQVANELRKNIVLMYIMLNLHLICVNILSHLCHIFTLIQSHL